ncbi:MAG: hypothetical protein IME99_08020 [Proteobacteria bacterium]|nr:hypothetical protein [Pseudomonadota bacterium]
MKRFFVGKFFLAAACAAVAFGVVSTRDVEAGAINLENIKAVAISAITPVKAAEAEDVSTLKMKSIKEAYMASARLEAIKAGEAPSAVDSGSVDAWLTKVETGKVNMVTNRVDSDLASTTLSGGTYFVNGDMGTFSIEENPSNRFAIDPTTSAKVDKANATAMADASGRIHYFASDSTVKDFFAKAAANTAYGFSPAK